MFRSFYRLPVAGVALLSLSICAAPTFAEKSAANDTPKQSESKPAQGDAAMPKAGDSRNIAVDKSGSGKPQLMLKLPKEAAPGETIRAQVMADAALKNLAGAMIILRFDEGLFEDVRNDGEEVTGEILKNPMVAAKSKVGRINIGMVTTKGKNGPGILAAFPLVVSPHAKPGRHNVRLDVELNDPFANGMSAASQGTTFQIKGKKLSDKKHPAPESSAR